MPPPSASDSKSPAPETPMIVLTLIELESDPVSRKAP